MASVAYDPGLLEERHRYKLLTGCVVPRPIALVTTLSDHGVNAAPFSLFNMVATDPPMLAFSIGGQGNGREKDTLANIRSTPQFVVHICSESIASQMNVCATDFPANVSEIAEAGFATVPSMKIGPPRIVQAPVQMECTLAHLLALGRRHHLVIGEVVMFHFHAGLVDERYNVDVLALRPVGRLSGPRYTRVREVFELERQFIGATPAQLS
ncbi:MAG TPA: flavin reductase family protein [Vicinamibacterales bacterium]|nr:flavin reductase family protein [Vicinamibacterales bacterium]